EVLEPSERSVGEQFVVEQRADASDGPGGLAARQAGVALDEDAVGMRKPVELEMVDAAAQFLDVVEGFAQGRGRFLRVEPEGRNAFEGDGREDAERSEAQACCFEE